MRRNIFAILLVMIMVFSLAACGQKETEAPEPSATESPAETKAPEETLAPGTAIGEDFDPMENEGADETAVPDDADSTESSWETDEPKTPESETPEQTTPPEEESGTDSDYTPSVGMTEYERYNSMSGEQQQAYMESFASVEDFVAWYNAAREEYESGHIEIDGEINAEDIVGK